MFNINDTLILADNNEYAIVDQFVMDGVNYIYLVDINDNSNLMFGRLENDEIVEITNSEENEKAFKRLSERLNNKQN